MPHQSGAPFASVRSFPKEQRYRAGVFFFLPSPSSLSSFALPPTLSGYYFCSPQSSSVIKSNMAATTIRTWTSFRPPRIRLHCSLFMFKIESLYFHKIKMFSYLFLNGQRLIIIACKQTLCLGKGWKNWGFTRCWAWKSQSSSRPSFRSVFCGERGIPQPRIVCWHLEGHQRQ